MLSLDVFLPRLLPSVPGCTDPLARQALLDAAIEFCEQTQIVRVITDPQPVSADVASYSVDIPSSQRVTLVQHAWYGNRELKPAPSEIISNAKFYNGTASGPDAVPAYFYEGAVGEVQVYPIPGSLANQSLVFRVATKPSRSATQVENVLYEDWAEAIVAGARERLHAIPDVPFSSANAMATAMALFNQGISRARSEAQRGRIRGSISAQPRSFGI